LPGNSGYGSPAMEFRILGPLEVSAGDGALKVGGPKQRAVLAHLILRANRAVSVELLIDGLWGEEPPETAKNTLQTYVYRLRQVLGEHRISSGSGGYVLHAEADEIDAARFEAMVRSAKAEIQADPARAADELGDALALWRGPPLSDLSEEPSLRGEIARLEELHLAATEHRIAAEIAAGGHSTVVSELEALTSRYPLRERMWANLMLALYRLGRQAEALATYQRAREVLADELGAEPSEEMQSLHEQILGRDPALGAQEPPKRPAVKPSRVDLQPGTEFAGYRIVSTLGRGGMAVVYLAEHDWLQRKVALKVLAPQLTEDERFRERFVRESRLAASLDHPNVVPIYEAGASGGDLFIAMRYVEGTDLRTVLAESGALDPARAIWICRQVAAALDAAHEQGLVHRDVKPGNVLVARTRGSEAGEHVYLSDFGLTKRSTSESGVTGTGQFVGTLDYAAPEQFQGGTPDARTDVYSLGCVLFECLTGHPPFRSENDAGLMYAHLQDAPPRVTAEQRDLPNEIDAVIARAMSKVPEQRQPSAGALVDEASTALRVGVSGQDDEAGGRRSPLRRLMPILAVAAALLVGIVVTTLLQGDPSEPAGAADGETAPTLTPKPTVAPSFRTVERPLNADEERLLASVPPDVKAECLPLDRARPIQNELAALVCHDGGVEVLYELLPTQADMNAAFQQGANSRQAPDGDCAVDHLATSAYTIDGTSAGNVLCYTTTRNGSLFAEDTIQQSHIEWTDANTSIYAHAVRNDLADLSLYEWWLSSAGPVVSGAEGPTEKDASPSASVHRLRDGTYLAAPPRGCGSRGETCQMNIDEGAYEINGVSFETEEGSVLLQKPNAIVFKPTSGPCLAGVSVTLTSRAAVFEWQVSGASLTLERISGGRCAGPQGPAQGSWTRAPDGVVAVEEGGEIELVDPGGALIGSTTQPNTNPNSWPDWSPDGSRIVYAGVAGASGYDLYVMNADGTETDQITTVEGDERAPEWSPDGERIVVAFDEGLESVRTGLATVSPDGSGYRKLFERANEYVDIPLWSPDGNRIAFTIFDGSGVPFPYVIDADGAGVVRIGDLPGVVVAWTPDGDRVIVSKNGSLVSMRPDGSGQRIFVEDPPEDGRVVMDWSPDGRWIVMSSPSSIGTDLYLMRADGSQVFNIGHGTEPSWRPDAP
jgi:serine/threonine protein kinase/DNA-binding SARP family transcriptional activator/Tol biopolymer transport system component